MQVSLRLTLPSLSNAMTAMHTLVDARPGLSMGSLVCAALAACGGGGHEDTQDAAPTVSTGNWSRIADDNGQFTLRLQRTVRYGAAGKWVQKTLPAGTYACGKSTFGRDPSMPAQLCEVFGSSAPATSTALAAILSWDASSGATGYRLYYGTAPRTYRQAKGTGVAVGNVTACEITNLKSATLYYFAVTAVDGSDNESPYSNEVSKQTP